MCRYFLGGLVVKTWLLPLLAALYLSKVFGEIVQFLRSFVARQFHRSGGNCEISYSASSHDR